MANVSVSLPSDGTTADVADYNTPVTTIVNEINGNLDNSNIKSGAAISGSKIADASIDIGAKASTWDGWIAVSDSWSYASSTTVTVPTDATTKYSKGDFVKFVQTSTKYFRITNVAATTLTLQAEASGVTVANAAITGIYYSKAATPQGGPLNNVPWWQEIGRTTLSVAGDTISVTSLPTRNHLMVLIYAINTGGTQNVTLRFNGDSGNNYGWVRSTDFAAASTSSSTSGIQMGGAAAQDEYIIANITNTSAQEKLIYAHATQRNTAGAANLPSSRELTGKWANTSAQISRVDAVNAGTGDFAIGSEMVVLGHD